MDTQEQRNRLDEENIPDQNTDVSRSENRQAAADADRHPARNTDAEGDGGGEQLRNRTTGNEGSHKEGQYDKQSDKPTMDPGHTDQ